MKSADQFKFVSGGNNVIMEVMHSALHDLHMRGELPHEDPALYLQRMIIMAKIKVAKCSLFFAI